MSTVLMGQCWPLQMPPSAKAVLMSLADQANDAGVCWPAIGTICKRTCLSERTVQSAISWLCGSGVLLVNRAPGRSTNYQINPAGFGAGTVGLFDAPPRGDNGRGTPANAAPRSRRTPQPLPPAADAPTPANAAPTPADAAPITVKNRQRTAKEKFDAAAIELPDWLDRELWERWVRDRKARGKPVSEEGAALQVARLDTFRAEGHTPKAVIEHSMAGGYQGLFAPSSRPGAPAPQGSASQGETVDEYNARIERERAAAEADRQASMNSKAARDAALARLKKEPA